MKAKAHNKSNFRVLDNIWGYAFVLIPILGNIIFVFIPLIMTIYASFTAWPLGQKITDAKWVGLQNYITMFNTPLFWKSLGNTIFYMIGLPIGIVLSLILAVLMNRGTRYENVFRVIYYVPAVTSVVAITFVFQRMFMSDGGVINNFLTSIGISNPPNWMSHPSYTKWVIIIMAVWRGLGSSAIMYIAGMQGIPRSYYEAAIIDGANAFQIFRRITLPLLAPVTFYLLVTGVIGGAQMYVEPRLMFSGNGPANSTFTTVIHLYDNTFRNSKAGYGSAVATVLGIFVFIVTAIQLYINDRGERVEKAKVKK